VRVTWWPSLASLAQEELHYATRSGEPGTLTVRRVSNGELDVTFQATLRDSSAQPTETIRLSGDFIAHLDGATGLLPPQAVLMATVDPGDPTLWTFNVDRSVDPDEEIVSYYVECVEDGTGIVVTPTPGCGDADDPATWLPFVENPAPGANECGGPQTLPAAGLYQCRANVLDEQGIVDPSAPQTINTN
jgi:hypothetical protein